MVFPGDLRCPKTRVLLWVYGDQLWAVLDNVVLAEYQVAYLHAAGNTPALKTG
jgi:hypothetical protein